ncbi:MAG: DUF5763 domain-containing protein [Saprospiraceae bacterium]
MYKSFLIIIISAITFSSAISQRVYKTPSGKRYHLKTCKMVENVSNELICIEEIEKYHLTPCKICKPPVKNKINFQGPRATPIGKAKTVQCKGITKSGNRCEHMTSLANGYCYQHTEQNSGTKKIKEIKNSSSVYYCGARTKSGGTCKRKVKKGEKCYQHK